MPVDSPYKPQSVSERDWAIHKARLSGKRKVDVARLFGLSTTQIGNIANKVQRKLLRQPSWMDGLSTRARTICCEYASREHLVSLIREGRFTPGYEHITLGLGPKTYKEIMVFLGIPIPTKPTKPRCPHCNQILKKNHRLNTVSTPLSIS